ncbi:cell division control protein Cdc25 [Ascosphaera apis ARSEF 7405]|uniref:Cell division control protein Cdc25 n=1 Tax=Ascosphaera apis ARSEF 7405 TaxID=392613 RepID=A0A162ILA4_9EURO|nr:cell division control protein Cdc25 [Ascosphaera apis ARSEF 7405]
MSSPFLNLPSNHPVPPTTALYVRALYDYDSNSPSSISFRAGDLIRVLNRLDSGWWDGILDNVRGWFPSNYTVVVAEEPVDPDEDVHLQALTGQLQQNHIYEDDEEEDEEGDDGNGGAGNGTTADTDADRRQQQNQHGVQDTGYNDAGFDQDHRRRPSQAGPSGIEKSTSDEGTTHKSDQEKASWVPRLTQHGQVFYFNELTGESAVDISPDDIETESPSITSRRNTVINANVSSVLQQQHAHVPESSRSHGHAATSSTASNRIPPESLIAGMNQDEELDDEQQQQQPPQHHGDNRASMNLDSTLAQLVSSNTGPMPSGTGLEDESTLIGNTTITPANAGSMTSTTSIRMSGAPIIAGNAFARKPSVATVDSIQSSSTINPERTFKTPFANYATTPQSESVSSSGSASMTSLSSDIREVSPHTRQTFSEGYSREGVQSQVTVVPDTATTKSGNSAGTTSIAAKADSRSRARGNSTAAAPNEGPGRPNNSLHFLPDTHHPIRPTWNSILAYTRSAVAQYRVAVNAQKLQLYIPLVENISDQLRFLLAAASDTTDNHSGTPSVISGNKELSPEFRNMMSRFSKMVVNSHLAIGAAEYVGKPTNTTSSASTPSTFQEDGVGDVNGNVNGNGSEKLMDAELKCISESYGFEEAMEKFVDRARALRGEDVVQLIPAFMAGSEKRGSGICVGGNWSGNGVFDASRGGTVRSISSVLRRQKAAKREEKRKKVASAFLELNDNDDDDDDEEVNKSGADRDEDDSVFGPLPGHGTGDDSHLDDAIIGQSEDDSFEDSMQDETSSDGYSWDQYYQYGDLDSLSEDDEDKRGYDYGDEGDDDDDDESFDLGLNLGGETSGAESADDVINSGSERKIPSRYGAVRRSHRDRAYTNEETDTSDSAAMGMAVDGKTRHPQHSNAQEDYDTDASVASLAAAAAAADTALRNRMGRGRARTNTLNGPAGNATSPGPISVIGNRSVSVSASTNTGCGKLQSAASFNRNTVIIEGDIPESNDFEAPPPSEKADFTEEAKKKLDSGAPKLKRAPAIGPIRSRPVHPRPRIKLTPRSLQKITPLRTALESALRKLDTSTVTTVDAIGGASNRSSASVPSKPASKGGDDEVFGLGMASPSLTLASSMSSMSMSTSAHTPSTLTVAGRDALAERVCAAAMDVLRAFQPLARYLERFDLSGLMDDAFVESLHAGFVDGSGNVANPAQGHGQGPPPMAVRTGSESSFGPLPTPSTGYSVAGNGFGGLMHQQPAPARVFTGEDAFGNPTIGQSIAGVPSHAALQSPSLNSPSGSNTSLSVPSGDGGSSILPSPAPSTPGATKALPKPVTQAQALTDAFAYKQRLYDAIGALVLACQAIGAPLADEWCAAADENGSPGNASVRGSALEAMDDRIGVLRGTVGMVKGILEQLTIALQTLLGFGVAAEQARRRTLAVRRQGMGGLAGVRSSSAVRASRGGAAIGMRFGSSAGPAEFKGARKARMMKMNVQPSIDKANRFFGEKTPTTPTHASYSPGAHGGPGADHSSRVPPPPLPVSAGMTGVYGGVSVPSPTNTTPWFLSCDHEHDVTFEERDGVVMLKSGTLPGLVEQLTRHDKLDTSFHSTFLLTYRSFTTATVLLEILMHRFTLPPPYGLDDNETQLWTRMKQSPIRIRVVNTLKTWLENYWMEPNDDTDDGPTTRLLKQIQIFVTNAVLPTKTPGGTQLLALVDKRLKMGLEGKDQQVAMSRKMTPHVKDPPAPMLPKNLKKLKLLDINPEEMARQLSLIEIKLYARIRPTECLNKTWTKKTLNLENGQQYAPNIKAMIRHSNQLTNWVAETILKQSDIKRRVAVIKFFTNVADKCGKMNNYSSLMTIISALATAPIDRLGRTWYQVSARTMAMLERMRTLMQTTKNFALYRQTIHNVNLPCIPFLGIYLTDLIFTEDGIPSKTPENASHINFSKWRKTAAVIQEIQQFQNGTYQFQPVPELQEWILQQMHNAQDCSTKAAYDRSLEIEPREREDEKITRLLSESGFL